MANEGRVGGHQLHGHELGPRGDSRRRRDAADEREVHLLPRVVARVEQHFEREQDAAEADGAVRVVGGPEEGSGRGQRCRDAEDRAQERARDQPELGEQRGEAHGPETVLQLDAFPQQRQPAGPAVVSPGVAMHTRHAKVGRAVLVVGYSRISRPAMARTLESDQPGAVDASATDTWRAPGQRGQER